MLLTVVSASIVALSMILTTTQWTEKVQDYVAYLSLAYLIMNYAALCLQLYIAFIFFNTLVELMQRKAMANYRQMLMMGLIETD